MADVRLSVEDGIQVSPLDEDNREIVVRTKATARQITLNFVTGGFGIGLFTLPWSTAGASLIPATILILFVMLLNAWTISILVEAAEKYQVFDLGSILSKLPGRASKITQAIVNLAIWISLFLCLVGYITVMANVTTQYFHGTGSIFENRNLDVVLASIIVLPLCFLDQAYLSFTSFLAVVVNIFIFIVVSSITPKHTDNICILGVGTGNIAMFSAMMQAIIIQMCVLPMYGELEDRSPAKFNRIVATAFSILFLVFVAFAVVGYITFGPHVDGNILDDIPHTPIGKAAKVGAALCVAAVFPIMEKTMVAPVRNVKGSAGKKRLLYILATFASVALSMLVSLGGFSLDYLNVVNGAFSCGVFVGLCPAIVGLFLLDCSFPKRMMLCTLLVLGITMGLLGIKFTDNYEDALEKSCFWKVMPHIR